MSKNPVRLHKEENFTSMEKIDDWAIRHAHILLPLCIITLLVLFVLLCYSLVGISATESGIEYNAMERII